MLKIYLLGQFDVRRDGERIVIPSRAGQALFAFLLLNAGTLFRREYLAALLWSNLTEAQARHHLRQALWRVRKALCPGHVERCEYFFIDEIEIGFNPQSAYWLDVSVFKRIGAPHSTTELMTTAALYRGELLPGFYEEWILRERQVLDALFEARMCELLEQLVAAREWSCVLEWAEHWIALCETPEPAFRALMQGYAALGDHAKIAQTFSRCQRALKQALDVEPAAETIALYKTLLEAPTAAPL